MCRKINWLLIFRWKTQQEYAIGGTIVYFKVPPLLRVWDTDHGLHLSLLCFIVIALLYYKKSNKHSVASYSTVPQWWTIECDRLQWTNHYWTFLHCMQHSFSFIRPADGQLYRKPLLYLMESCLMTRVVATGCATDIYYILHIIKHYGKHGTLPIDFISVKAIVAH